MKADDLIDAFGHIDPKYVSDAEVEIKSKSRMKRMVYVIREKIPLEKEQPAHITISAAMCMTAFVLIIGAGMFYGRIRNGYSGNKITLWIRFSMIMMVCMEVQQPDQRMRQGWKKHKRIPV